MPSAERQSTGRFGILDALRGFAGLAVVLFHLMEAYEPQGVPVVPGHGYLAVEFFLLLTGFVLGHAYDARWRKGLGVGAFFRRRLVRLHPMAILGTVVGLLVYLFLDLSEGRYFGMAGAAPRQVAVAALLAVLMIPVAGHGALNPFNACSWTLYYEYVANVLYAVVLRRLATPALLALTVVAGVWSAVTALNVDLNAIFGTANAVWAEVAKGNCTLVGGWSLSAKQVYIGFVRTLFPLFLGLFLARRNWRITLPAKVAFPLCLGVFAAVLFCPCSYTLGAGIGMPWLNGVFEWLSVAVVLPVLMLIGAGSAMPNARLDAVGRFLGELSYPLYMTHFPFHTLQISLVAMYYAAYPGWVFVVATAAQFALSVALGWAAMRFFDEPVQRMFKGK